jgi:predicted Zn-dependent protease
MTLLRKKRLVVVLCIAAVTAAGIGGGVAYRLRKIRHDFLVARDRGYGEYQRGDNAGAIRDLRTYLSRFPQDTTALAAFADARMKVEEPDGSHIIQTIGALRQLADLQPESMELQHRLADMYVKGGLNTECISLADKLLARDPKDAPVLHDKALALYRLRKFKDASEVQAKYLEVRPEELDAQVAQLEMLSHLGPPMPDLVKNAEALRKAHPEDVKWKILLSIAHALVNEPEASRSWARESAKTGAPDPAVAAFQVMQLWRTGEVPTGDVVLEKSAAHFRDPALQAMWAKRLFQLQRFGELVALTPVEGGNANSWVNVEGYQCLGWVALGDMAKAQALQQRLATDPHSTNAHDWAAMLAITMAPEATTLTARGRVIKEIADRHGENAYFQMMQAGIYQANGDMRSTMKAWDTVAVREPAWAEPITHIAETLLGLNRFSEAAKAAQSALVRAPEDRNSLVCLALASAGAAGTAAERKSLLPLFDSIHEKYPSEQRTIALRTSLTAQFKGKDAALKVVGAALSMQPPPTLLTMLQLATVSRTENLGSEGACFAAAEHAYGMVPDLAYAKATALLGQAKAAEGAALLKEQRAKATKDVQAWDLAYARYLELSHDGGARELWAALSEKYASDQRTQWLALSAPSIQNDHEAAGKVIERLRAVMGETDFSFKLARARWLLQGAPDAGAVSEATGLLTEMAKGEPDVLAPHLLLAECLQRNQNTSGAIDQLEIAAALAPDSASIAIQLTNLLQNQGNTERASTFLGKLADRKDLSEAEARQCANLLARQGLPDQAIALLEASAKKGETPGGDGETPEGDRLILAALHAQVGHTETAGALFDSLMKHPSLPIIRLAAQFYATHGRLGDGQKAIAQLRDLQLEPSVLATEQGDFAAKFGKPDEVVAAYSAGLKAAPTNEQIWYRLIRFHLQNGSVKEAEQTIDQAVSALPNDKILAGLQAKKQYIESLSGDERCRPILMSLLTSPQHAEAAEAALARLDRSKGTTTPDPQLAVDLSRLADRYPQYAALQTLAVEVDVLMGRLDDAVTISMRAMQTFPASPEPARLASSAFAAAGKWSETLGASNQWRARAGDQTLAPDMMIGYSYLGMQQPDQTLQQIKPYMEEAANDPETYGAVIVLYGRSQLAKHQVASAQERLWPLAKSSKRGMVAFLQIAGHDTPPEVGKRWLTMARPELHGDIELQFSLATAAWELSMRAGDASLLPMALEDLEKSVGAGKAEPAQLALAHLGIGMIQEKLKSPEAAEAAYRKAVELNPKSDAACNNLAMLLAQKGAMPEALAFANRAVALAPKVAPYQDTLAYVQEKAGNYTEAIEHLRTATQLQPANTEWRVNLAQTYLRAGQADKARATLANADGTPMRFEQVPAELQERLTSLQQRLDLKQ